MQSHVAVLKPARVKKAEKKRDIMKLLFIITTDDGETIYNAMRLANVGVNKGDEISVFMLGKGVLFEQSGTEQFKVMEQVNQFEGDFYV
jgi:uncharacterized protein involved in oxidation of intracellular sulfur